MSVRRKWNSLKQFMHHLRLVLHSLHRRLVQLRFHQIQIGNIQTKHRESWTLRFNENLPNKNTSQHFLTRLMEISSYVALVLLVAAQFVVFLLVILLDAILKGRKYIELKYHGYLQKVP